jgi:hypothetical protein
VLVLVPGPGQPGPGHQALEQKFLVVPVRVPELARDTAAQLPA